MSDYTTPYFDAVAQLTAPTAPFEVETVDVAGVPLKAFKNAERSLGAFLAAGRHHDANLFLQYQGEDWTYGAFFKAVDKPATGSSMWLRYKKVTPSLSLCEIVQSGWLHSLPR